jgi:hypothetical protein
LLLSRQKAPVPGRWRQSPARSFATPLFGSRSPPFSAPAARIVNAPAPVSARHSRPGIVSSSHLGEIGLDLMSGFLAPHDQPDAGGGSIAERHWRTGLGVHSFGARGSRRLGRVPRVAKRSRTRHLHPKSRTTVDYEKSPVLMDRAFNKFTNAEQDTNINFASSKSMVDCSRRQCLMLPSLLVYPQSLSKAIWRAGWSLAPNFSRFLRASPSFAFGSLVMIQHILSTAEIASLIELR